VNGASRHDPFVVLRDSAQIAEEKAKRLDAAEQAFRAAQALTFCDLLSWSVAVGETVTVATRTAGQVNGVARELAQQFLVVEETQPVPRIVIVALPEIVSVSCRRVSVKELGQAAACDTTTTLLTVLEDNYRADAVELTLRNGVTLCAPVHVFGDDVLLLDVARDTVLCVAAGQIALAAIPPPRRRGRLHTGG